MIVKANEFVKKFGWEYAKERMEYCKGARLVGMEIDLERLVASWELITRKFGTIDKAKKYIESAYEFSPFTSAVKQAIADVESCQ